MHIQRSRYYRVAALTMLSLLVMFSTTWAQGNFTDIGTPAVIPVVLYGHGVAGLQATLTYDPSLMSVGTPVLANEAEGLMLDSRIEEGTLLLVVMNLGGQTLSARRAVLTPEFLTDADKASLTITDLIASSALAQIIPVQFGTVIQPVFSGKETATPTSFTLHAASPNQFNPATTIDYEVPRSTHLQMSVDRGCIESVTFFLRRET